MNRTTYIRPALLPGIATRGIGSRFGGIVNGFLQQASARADVAATK
jgi:hypothetical protein